MSKVAKLGILTIFLLVLTLILIGLVSATVNLNDYSPYSSSFNIVNESEQLPISLNINSTLGRDANCTIKVYSGSIFSYSNNIIIPNSNFNQLLSYVFTFPSGSLVGRLAYNINLTCNDSGLAETGDTSSLNPTFYYDNLFSTGKSLNITTNFPINNFIYNSTQSVEVNFSTITQKNYVYPFDCNLVANNTHVSDTLSVSTNGDQINLFTFTTLSTGLHNLSLNCTTAYGETFTNDSLAEFVYDPDFVLGGMVSNLSVTKTVPLFVESNPNALNISFNFTASKDYAFPANCNIFASNGNVSANNVSVLVSQNATIINNLFDISSLDDGTYNLSLNCTTNYGEWFNETNFSELIVDSNFQSGIIISNMSLVNVSSSMINNTPNITLSMNVSALKDYAFPISCYVNTNTSFTSDNPLVFTNADNASNLSSQFNFTGLTQGTHDLDLECITNYGESFFNHSFAEFIYDASNPTFTTYSWLPVINRPSLLYFLISDAFSNINFSSIRALINNSDNTYNLYSANVNEIDCSGVGLGYNCSLNISDSLVLGTYNITLFGNDSAINTNLETHEIIMRNSIAPVPLIEDNGTNISTPTIFVNWTWSPSPYIAYYNLSLIVTDGPNLSELMWVNVSNDSINYTFTDAEISNHYGGLFYVNITPVDIIGNTASPSSTDGLLLQDTSAPEYHNVSIIPDLNHWVQSNSSLNIFINFTDDETGIDYFTYSIGTTVYPFPGWNSVVSEATTTENNFTVTGLNLVEGQNYYVSARAKNNYPYYWENSESSYYSSEYDVWVDSHDPVGGYISYNGGPVTTSSILIDYNSGYDLISGYYNSSLMRDRTTLSGSTCNSFSGSYTFVQYANNNTNPAPISASLESGYCYRFVIFTYDKAGNRHIISGDLINNVTVDLTPPSVVSNLLIVDGYLTPDTTIEANWGTSIDGESGLSHYQYALSTLDDEVDDDIVHWTNISSNIHNITLHNLGLTHLESYYFKIKAINNYNLSSVAVSHPIAYVDNIPPAPLDVVSVGDDTSSLWIDNTSNDNTTIILSGEDNIDCIWSYYDIEYITPSVLVPYVHDCHSNGTGLYQCNISQEDGSALEEGIYDVYVSCRDYAGNIQRSNTNTNITFAKDIGAPLVSVYNLNNLYVVGTEVYVNIQEATLDSANYVVTTESGITDSGILSLGNNTLTLNISSNVSLHTLSIFANDSYGQETITNITFTVNSSIPAGYMSIPNNYVNSDVNVTLAVSFFNNYSYNISGTGSISRDYFLDYTNMTNITNYNLSNIFINASEFTDGNYTIYLVVNNSINGVSRSESYNLDFVIDKIDPDITPISPEFPSMIYDDEIAEIFITVVGDVKNISVNYNGSSNYPIEPVDFDTVIVPNAQRYKAVLNPQAVNETMLFNWSVYDLAENNAWYANSIVVPNRVPFFDDSSNNFTYLANIPFSLSLGFDDDDITQEYTDYNCTMDSNPSFDLVSNPMACYLNWSNPTPGTYEFNLTVNDHHNGVLVDNVTKSFNITFLNSSLTSIHVNSTYPVSGYVNGRLNYMEPMLFNDSTNELYLTIHNDSNHEIYLYVDDVEVIVPDVNISENGTLEFVKRPLMSSEYPADNLSSSLRYHPLVAYGLDINYTSTKNYVIKFNLSNYNLGENISKVYVFKYPYNFSTRDINFTDTANAYFLTPVIDNVSMIASITVSNFSMFIVAKDTYIPPVVNNTPPPGGDDNPPPSHNSGSSSGGSFFIPVDDNQTNETLTNETNETIIEEPIVEPTCFDNIKNQNEEKVDCGGSCVSCPVENNSDATASVKTTNPREELPEAFTEIKSKPETKSKSLTLWIMIALLLIGGVVGVGVVSTHHHTTNAIQSIISNTDAQDIVDVANFIKMHELYNVTLQDKDLLGMGFSLDKVNLARFALENDAMVKSVMAYLENNKTKGYTTDELCNWLVSKDVHEGVVLLAKDRLSESNPHDVLKKYTSPYLPVDVLNGKPSAIVEPYEIPLSKPENIDSKESSISSSSSDNNNNNNNNNNKPL